MEHSFLEVLLTSNLTDFYRNFYDYIASNGGAGSTVWKLEGFICEPASGIMSETDSRFDIFDLGFDGQSFHGDACEISSFDGVINISRTVFLINQGDLMAAVTFHNEVPDGLFNDLVDSASLIGKRIAELKSRETSVNVYVDYQKKIEFIKDSSRIFKSIELEEVVAVSLSYFMEVFASEAACSILEERVVGYGIDENDLTEGITIRGQSVYDFVAEHNVTEFFEDGIESTKFNINNMFFVYEETINLRILLFNIHFDVVPDKEFSELVSSVVSIAVENAVNHEKMTAFKVEESEMTNTVDILNRFVDRNIRIEGRPDVYGICYPARSAGGDYLIIRDDGDKMFFCVADVCGKGYSAAVFTVVLSVFSDMADMVLSGAVELKEVVQRANDFLIKKNFSDRFITGFFGLLDKCNCSIEYIGCGHEPGIIFSDSGVKLLDSDYMPMGIMEETYQTKTVQVGKGQSLFIYTDGIVEYIPEEDVEGCVESVLESNVENPVQELYDRLVTDVDAQKDDFTCLLIKFGEQKP